MRQEGVVCIKLDVISKEFNCCVFDGSGQLCH